MKIKSKKKVNDSSNQDLLSIAFFILLDALIFHEALSSIVPKIDSLNKADSQYQNFLIEQWGKVLEIDYYPIFNIALIILKDLPASPTTENILKKLIKLALQIVSSGVLLKHDFMGRIYHKLLLNTTSKYYATYYTSIPAAIILSNLLLKTEKEEWDFSNLEKISDFRIIDPACGSGTLLSASYSVLRDLYVVSSDQTPKLKEFHKILLENVLHGWDILDYATHLTLTTLALHNYKSFFQKSNIYTLPIGRGKTGKLHLGSLDYLFSQGELTGKGFTEPSIIKNLEKVEELYFKPEKYDVVIMNPPFLRSANPTVKFGFLKHSIKQSIDKELQKLLKELKMTGLGQAGLGALFIILGDKLLKNNGRMGIVIPKAFLSGVSWKVLREFLEKNYRIIYVISNHDPGDKNLGIEPWNWSENTDLSEILIVLEKKVENKQLNTNTNETENHNILLVNVINKPKSEIESLFLSHEIIKHKRILQNFKSKRIKINNKDVCILYKIPQSYLKEMPNWLIPCLFANTELNELAIKIREIFKNFLVNLEDAVSDKNKDLGMDCGTVSKKFKLSTIPTSHKVIWGYSLDMDQIDISNKIKFAETSLSDSSIKKGNLLIPYSLYLQNHKLSSFYCNSLVSSNAFWTVKIDNSTYAKLLSLWLNSTFGILLLLSTGIVSRGHHFEFKKENLKKLLVLKSECLNHIGDYKIENFFYEISVQKFDKFREEFKKAIGGNSIRKKIDDFFIKEFSLEIELDKYYEILSLEPAFTMKRL